MIEELEDFVGNVLQPTSKPFGRNRMTDYEEDDYLIVKKIMQCKLAAHARHKKHIEVWTEEQKKLLARIDELLARPIAEKD
jgi:hypothetical protein